MRLVKQTRLKEACDDASGSSLLEMALCTSLVLLVILGIMECSLAVYTEHYVESAAASGARYATVRGSSYKGTSCASTTSYFCEAGSSDITKYIQANAAPAITASKITVTTAWTGTTGGGGSCDVYNGTDSPGCLVRVTITYPFKFMLPAPFNTSITFKAVRSTVISQ